VGGERGFSAGATALWLWFGTEWLALMFGRGKDLRMVDKPTPLSEKIDQMLTEARVVLPGAQALFGFQLAVVFTESFATSCRRNPK
jgi:Family of unknown function (DUF6328)